MESRSGNRIVKYLRCQVYSIRVEEKEKEKKKNKSRMRTLNKPPRYDEILDLAHPSPVRCVPSNKQTFSSFNVFFR